MAVKSVKRIDWSGRLGKVKRTPQGGMRIDASPVAKVGILEYIQPDGSVLREYNPPEVLQSPAFLDSLRDAPVTNEHPSEYVSPDNFRRYAAGYAAGSSLFADGKAMVPLAIQDSELMVDIDGGKREEISLGYDAEVDYTPGETPSGEKYDGIRTSIVVNHIAVVSAGRAGPEVRLRLDAKGDSITTDTSDPPKDPGMTPEQIVQLQKDLATANARADSASSELETARRDLKTAQDKLAAQDKIRVDGLRAKAKALRPKLAEKIDAAEEAYVVAVIEAAEGDTPAETPAPKTERTDSTQALEPAEPVMDARERSIRRKRGEKV